MLKSKSSIKDYITTSLLIKLSLVLFLISSSVIIYQETIPPNQIEINEIHNLSIETPIQIRAHISKQFISNDFSVLQLKDPITNHTITGTLQENASFIQPNRNYIIIGKVSQYKSEKQINIYEIMLIS